MSIIKLKPSSWFAPVTMLTGFILVFGLLIWLILLRIDRDRQNEIKSHVESVSESVKQRLSGNEDYLLMMAKDRAANLFDYKQYQNRGALYVKNHPELINITWVDSTFTILDVVPHHGNEQIIGHHLDLAEPKKASLLAKQTRQPQYTKVFEAIQGNPSFEIWIPVYQGDTFLGLMAGVYSCENVVNHLIPEQVRSQYQISFTDGKENNDWQQNQLESETWRTASSPLINTSDMALYLRFTRSGRGFIDRTLLIVILLCVCLVVGMSYMWWRITVESQRRVHTEKQLQKQNEVFATLNQEYKVQNLELQKAKEKAEESDRLKSAFLANVSHEIRTPLNSIVGFSSLLGDTDLSEEMRNIYISMVESGTESLLALIDEILDLSKIEAQQLTLKKTDFSMDELLHEMFQVFSHQNGHNDVELRLGKNIVGKTFSIYSDRVRVKQVLTNLLSNAYKFTDKGFIELGYLLSEKQDVVLYVKDSGIGIEKKYHHEIFQRFRKLNEDSSRLYKGTGLGLAISEKIVQLLGGKIWVESESGIGTTFFFTLQDCQLNEVIH